MNKIFKLLIFTTVLFSEMSYGLGVLAGTSIVNRAKMSYSSDGIDYNKTSNQVNDIVDQLIDLKLEWIDINPILVESGERDVALTFLLKNIGNGEDKFTLTSTHDANSSFEPTNRRLYIDSNSNGLYDSSDEQVDSVELVPDDMATLFLVSDIPQTILKTAESYEKLQARSTIGGSGEIGREVKSGVIDGLKGGIDSAVGSYEVLGYRLNINKSAVVKNQFGSDIAIRGATITYSIDLTMDGMGEVEDIVVKDIIPKGTTYQGGSLTLDGTPLSDGIDDDVGSFHGGYIQVNIGSMRQTETEIPKQKISFKVEIK